MYLIIPSGTSEDVIRHQYDGYACDCFECQGIAIAYDNPKLYSLMTQLEESLFSKNETIAVSIAEVLNVPLEQVAIIGEALIKVGSVWIAIENGD